MKSEIILGITGTRNDPTIAQKSSLREIIDSYHWESKLHHGCCTGTDALTVMMTEIRKWYIIAHPPINKAHFDSMSYTISNEKLPEKDYISRNRDIVDECQMLVAVPMSNEEIRRSGTWSTVRYARSINRPRLIIWPSGNIDVEMR